MDQRAATQMAMANGPDAGYADNAGTYNSPAASTSEERAAVVLQASWRGYTTRKNLTSGKAGAGASADTREGLSSNDSSSVTAPTKVARGKRGMKPASKGNKAVKKSPKPPRRAKKAPVQAAAPPGATGGSTDGAHIDNVWFGVCVVLSPVRVCMCANVIAKLAI